MATLPLYHGGSKTFTTAELSLTLAQLTAADQAFCSAGDVAHVALGTGLLLVDVSFPPNRRLVEGYELSYEPSNPFGLQANHGTLNYTLQEALNQCGYTGTISALADVYMADYSLSGGSDILTTGQLVKSTGQIFVSAAELKSLAVGGNLSLSSGANTVTITDSCVSQSTYDAFEIATNASLATHQFDIAAHSSQIASNSGNIASNAADISTNAAAIGAKQDSISVSAPITLSNGTVVGIDTSGLQSSLANRGGSGAELLASNTIARVSGTGIINVSNDPNQQSNLLIEADTSALQASLTVQAPLVLTNSNNLSINTSSLPGALANRGGSGAALLASNTVARVSGTGIINVSNDPTDQDNLLVEADTTTLQTSIASKADQSDLTPIQAVVQNTGNGYYYLRTPASSSLIVSNGANTGSVAAFNFDGSSVLHGDVNVLGDLTCSGTLQGTARTEIQTAINTAQAACQPAFTTASPLQMSLNVNTGNFTLEAVPGALQTSLDSGQDVTIDVGRGDVYLEDNANDNADGSGVTLRTSNNPTNGSMFAVRSSGNAARLWVGQSITTTGANDLLVSYAGSYGGEEDTTKYKHSLTSTLAKFGTPCEVTGDLTVSGSISAASLTGGAATQVSTALAGKQDTLTPLGGSGNNLLNSQVPAGKLANIFGIGAVEVAAIYNPGGTDHGNLQISCDPFWCWGKVNLNGSIASSGGQVGFTVNRYLTGKYRITFASSHPLGTGDYTLTTGAGIMHNQIMVPTANDFEIWTRSGNNGLANHPFSFMCMA